ncbi:MAG: NFACT RNA binding domain-containing protein [Clostridia bacterium]|nr:NFACT RNA binding domain-containing protein [Clostridia bacterium]
MAFDGGFLHNVVSELQQAIGAHVDKIYQPARDVLVLTLRKKGFVKRLVLSAASGTARVHFTEQKYENPETPPMFCMLARKIFSAARLVAVEQKGLERVIEFTFDASNEMGDRVHPKIICELLSGSGNIILVGEDGKIYDAVRRSDIEKSDRLILSGATYRYPDSQNKLNILETDTNKIIDRISEQKTEALSTAMLKTLEGTSPLVCRELSYIYYGDISVADINDITPLICALNKLKGSILSGEYYITYKSDNTPADFCYMPITQYGNLYTYKRFDTPSQLLDAFYFERENAARITKASSDINKLVSNLLSRACRRKANREKELCENSNREDLRINGELIKANLYAIESGSTKALVQNYYDENMALTEIPLDPSLTPQQNAAKYFKDYKKSCGAVQSLDALIENDKTEISYLESVAESLTRCKTLADIAEIREELANYGYLKYQNKNRRAKKSAPQLTEYKSVEGYRILVGKNNTQNDYITCTLASKGDMWFHTKNIHGSHVVVLCGGEPISDKTIIFAATLAAKNSKAAHSAQVPVDYTPIKYVKKPSGAKAGMVIYTTNKTVFVTPEDNL